MLAFADTRFNLSETGEIRYVEGLWVSGTFFDALGVAPQLGRLIGPADDRPQCGYPGAVISHALWQREFGGRPDVLQQSIPFAGQRVPIMGVTPPSFFGVEVGRQFDVAMPICSSGFELRNHWWLAAIGRLKPGWTREQAQAHVQGILPGDSARHGAGDVSARGDRHLRGDARRPARRARRRVAAARVVSAAAMDPDGRLPRSCC